MNIHFNGIYATIKLTLRHLYIMSDLIEIVSKNEEFKNKLAGKSNYTKQEIDEFLNEYSQAILNV